MTTPPAQGQYWRETKGDDFAAEFEEATKGPDEFMAWAVTIKSDGCVDLYRNYVASGQFAGAVDNDYMHICDLDEFIQRMVELREIQKSKGFDL